jgi:copper(I)-binding protein
MALGFPNGGCIKGHEETTMKTLISLLPRVVLGAILGASIVLVQPAITPVSAQEYKAGSLTIDTPWTRATPGGAKMGGGYATITNTGDAPDRLIGASTAIAGKVEIHEMGMTDGVMRMREIEGGLEIPPGETVTLEPGGNHIMFMGLNEPLQKGSMVEVTLQFETAGEVMVMMPIAAIGAKTPDGAAGEAMDHSGHGDHSAHGNTN